ncbi:TetR/AcrR family transcriptional regulator [Pseudonocardia sp. CA-107938]|uniref:TetR/AcrR family transcriptional regulator n=1 Tax=Pseudonocardia sp. CA-107938 TaxID=3240021 RepID=UPI003D91BD60
MTDSPPGRRRAPSMTPDQRRAMIVAAALPLVAEHGTAVSTAQLARAAGIGEATIFRAFGDKDALLDACVAEALRPDNALDAIAEIPLDLPLEERLAEAARELDAHLQRMGTVIGALHATGRRAERPPPSDAAADLRARSTNATVDALAALMEPDAADLRLPVEQLAAVLLTQLFSRHRPIAGGELGVEEHVDLFLNGARA